MGFEELENLNADQILDLYEDILETPERGGSEIIAATYCWGAYVYNNRSDGIFWTTLCNK